MKKWYIAISIIVVSTYVMRLLLSNPSTLTAEDMMEKHFRGQAATIKRLKTCGFSPRSILDVGANVGNWTTDLSHLFKESNFFMIEGNDKHIDKLKTIGFPFEISLVGDKIRNISYYKAIDNGDGTGNSIFKENTEFQFTAVHATLYPLDTIIERREVGPFQMMKLDVQGAELLALEGARKTLEAVEVIVSEAGLQNYNEGAPTFFHLFKKFDELGYAMIDIVDIKREKKSGFVNQFDVIWLKKTSNLWTCTGFPKPKFENL